MNTFPYDIQLNIVNHLGIKDGKNFGKYLKKEEDIKKHMLTNEYLKCYIKNKEIYKICHAIAENTLKIHGDLYSAYKNKNVKPLRLNMKNSTFYTLYPTDLLKAIEIADIHIPQLPDRIFSYQFKTLSNGIFNMCYEGLGVYLFIVDDKMKKKRHILVRIPYDCDEFIYGFAASIVKILSSRIIKIPELNDWNIHCEYILSEDINHDPNFVRAIMSRYNTRSVDMFKHMFFEKILRISLHGNGYEYKISPWNLDSSIIRKEFALMKYCNTIAYITEDSLQRLNFTKNKIIACDVFVDPNTNQFYICDRPDIMIEEVGEN